MKLKVGTKLRTMREQRKYSHEEMAKLLLMAPSTYGRYERNETYMDMDTLAKVSEILDLPIQEFFPETFHINSTNHGNGQASLVMGNYTYYGVDESSKEMMRQNLFLKKENEDLKGAMKQSLEHQQGYDVLRKQLQDIKEEFETLKSILRK